MNWELMVALNVGFAMAVALLWTARSSSKKTEARKVEIRHRHSEFEIDPASVPQFKSTWRNAQ